MADLQPDILTLQETKVKVQGRIKIENHIVFERVRENKDGGGGILTSVNKKLNPEWVSEGVEGVEVLSVNIKTANKVIRVVNGYGPQEKENQEKRRKFWNHIQKEHEEAKNAGTSTMICVDGNAWLGKDVIKDDPNNENKNGKLVKELLTNNEDLRLMNAEDICQGVITRKRKVEDKVEMSSIDFIIVSDDMVAEVVDFKIDEDGEHAITSFTRKANTTKAKDSDHNSLILKLKLNTPNDPLKRVEFTNYNDQEGRTKYFEEKHETETFSKCFKNSSSKTTQAKMWRLKVEKARDITMIAKQGSKRKLRNRRGIFLLAILRGIIMKMVYDRNYDITEKNLTQFNVGGRKKMSARNNLFAIINEEA